MYMSKIIFQCAWYLLVVISFNLYNYGKALIILYQPSHSVNKIFFLGFKLFTYVLCHLSMKHIKKYMYIAQHSFTNHGAEGVNLSVIYSVFLITITRSDCTGPFLFSWEQSSRISLFTVQMINSECLYHQNKSNKNHVV